MPGDSLTITDNRTGRTYELPVTDGTIKALDLRQIKTGPDDFGLMSYDPAFTNTAATKSSITYIDATKGFSAIAATRSSNWPNVARISRPPTC